MFKHLTITTLFTVLGFASFAQLPMNTVEVTITETVDVPVKEYIYHVSNTDINSNNPFDFDFELEDFDDDFDNEEEEVFSMPKTISWMKEQLEGANFKCAVLSRANYDVDPGESLEDADKFDREIIEVRVKTLKDLNRLSKFVLQLDDAYGELSNIEFEAVETTHSTLLPQMMKKAKDKATVLAKTADKKIGEVLRISEGNGGLNLYGDELGSYMENMMELSSKLWKKEVPTSEKIKVTMKYVFELK